MKKLKNVLAVVFISGLFAVGAITVFSPRKTFSEQERRPLAKWPSFSFEKIISGEFFKDFDSALADQFTGRNELLGLKASTQKTLGKKDNSRVYFGKDNYLIEIHENLDEKQLQMNMEDMLSFYQDKFLKESNPQEASLIIAPTVAGAQVELLPKYAVEANQEEILAKANGIFSGTEVLIPDVLENFKSYKAGKEEDKGLYFRTDHHWTQKGAYIAFKSWLDKSEFTNLEEEYNLDEITNSFYGTTWAKANSKAIPADTITAYKNTDLNEVELYDIEGELIRKGIYNEKAADSRDPYEYFIGENKDYIKLITATDTKESQGRHLLIFKDSYANAFIPFLCPYYESITVIDLRFLKTDLGKIMEKEEFTDLLFLYNVVTFSDDNNSYKLIK